MERSEAMGTITIVQTSTSPESARRVQAFNQGAPFPIRIRGIENGHVVDRRVAVSSVVRAFDCGRDWDAVEDIVVHEAKAIVSNTGDASFRLDQNDDLETGATVSFPAKLARLLHARHRAGCEPLSIFPCELVAANGSALRGLVVEAARRSRLDPAFEAWLTNDCHWVNSLVDRIVSEPLKPIGAVAEPYALWAIQAEPGMTLPCRHLAIEVTDNLRSYELLKLHILNLGHTYLAERWLGDRRAPDETVREIVADPQIAHDLGALYATEVIPALAQLGLAMRAETYRNIVMQRFANPFLDHRLADIATNHVAKKAIRIGGLIRATDAAELTLKQPILRGIMNSGIAAIRAGA